MNKPLSSAILPLLSLLLLLLNITLQHHGVHARQMPALESATCIEDHRTFEQCSTTREHAIDCIMEHFAPPETPDEVPVHTLVLAWEYLLNPSQRKIAGSVENVIEACNPDRDAVFSRQKMLLNACHCIENCKWATRVGIVCNLAARKPNWRDNAPAGA